MRHTLASFALVALLAMPQAHAQHLPHQTATDFPFRCPKAGICLQATGKHNVFGGVRHTDHEVRFHAIYLLGEDDTKSPWCVAISDTRGKLLVSDGPSAGCDHLDADDTSLFGYKPTLSSDDKNADAADSDDEDDATAGCVAHLAGAELQPDHADGWAQVRALAQRWLDKHADRND